MGNELDKGFFLSYFFLSLNSFQEHIMNIRLQKISLVALCLFTLVSKAKSQNGYSPTTQFASTSSTEFTNDVWIDFGAMAYLDVQHSLPNWSIYTPWNASSGPNGSRKYDFTFRTTSTSGNCWEVETTEAFFLNGDTRFWLTGWTGASVNPEIPWPMSLDDDAGVGNYSKMRVYIQQGTTQASVSLMVAAYSTAYNAMDFHLRVTKLNKSMSSCLNTTLPWLKKVGDVQPTFGNTN